MADLLIASGLLSGDDRLGEGAEGRGDRGTVQGEADEARVCRAVGDALAAYLRALVRVAVIGPGR